jgi:hypothetical protein
VVDTELVRLLRGAGHGCHRPRARYPKAAAK